MKCVTSCSTTNRLILSHFVFLQRGTSDIASDGRGEGQNSIIEMTPLPIVYARPLLPWLQMS